MTYRDGLSGENLRAVAEHASAGAAVRSVSPHGSRQRRTVRRFFGKVRGASWALADQCIVSAVNFLTVYLFARHLSTLDFGVFMLAYTGLMLLTSMQTALVIQPHNVLGAGLARPEYQRFTASLVMVQMIACITVCTALGVVGVLIAHFRSPPTGSVLVALAIAAAPWMSQEFVRRVLYTRGESRAAAINDAVTYGLQLVGAFVLAVFWADRASPEAALGVLGGTSLAGVVMGLWQLRDYVRFGPGSRAAFVRTWGEVWNFGKWLTGQNILLWLGSHGHAWIVGLMLGAEQVGFYRAATHLINVMNPVRQAAYNYLPSRGSLAYQSGAAAGLSRWIRKVSWVLLVALVPFCIVLVGFPGSVLTFAYGQRYAHADLALILALATVAQCITFSKFPYDMGLLALRATRSIFYIHLIPVVLLLVSGTALIHFLGILGVPLSALIINSALLLATWIAYRRALKHSAAARTGAAP